MLELQPYTPGPAGDARIEKDGELWTLVLERRFRHAPEKVWRALTEPGQLSQWSPFDSDVSLAQAGTAAKLTTVGTPMVSETLVVRAEAPSVLQYNWGDREVRWELKPTPDGTHLTLWAAIDRAYIAMGAAGWHVCFDVLERWLGGAPVGRLVAGDALKFEGWQRLHAQYRALFGQGETQS